jgi:hypothetical protein
MFSRLPGRTAAAYGRVMPRYHSKHKPVIHETVSGRSPDESGTEIPAVGDGIIPKFIGEFWTSGQRQASSLHEVSYRACFKPQLLRYFIERFTSPGDLVYDPFGGRGTTAIEAGLMGRHVARNDANPLSGILTRPRLTPPDAGAVQERLDSIRIDWNLKAEIDLSMFYHPGTEAEIVSIRDYLRERRACGREDDIDRWVRMVATNRLTGHSPRFFSVYTLPPNQAVSAKSQLKINARRNQEPEYRNTKQIILKKTASLLAKVSAQQRANLTGAAKTAIFIVSDARETPRLRTASVQLTVTSPPFLDVVKYASDNWLRCWFNCLDSDEISHRITMAKTVAEWARVMGAVFRELARVTARGGWIAFEVGEIRGGKLKLEEHVVPLGIDAGLTCKAVIINSQTFTKTSNLWGITNNEAGTNTNRIALFHKE